VFTGWFVESLWEGEAKISNSSKGETKTLKLLWREPFVTVDHPIPISICVLVPGVS